jgi:pimeloyl-ACP methyl ester carboxylesterase
LFLHGVGRCGEDYSEFASALVAEWRVRALDFRGHGGSERTPGQYLVTDYVRDTVAFVRDEIRQPALIYGHSLGAMVALAVAATLPDLVRGIVLEDPPFHTMGRRIAQTPWQALFAGMRGVARSVSVIEQLAAALAELSVPVAGRSSPARLGELRSAESLRFSARCLAQLDPEVFTPVIEGRWLDGYDERALFAQVRCPVLLLQGDPSAGGAMTDVDAEAALGALPVCRRVRFPGVSHLIHQDQPAAALRALLEFATTLPSTTKSHEKASSLSAVPGV